jgi:enoyl-CoA hydratase/carnithine racemase
VNRVFDNKDGAMGGLFTRCRRLSFSHPTLAAAALDMAKLIASKSPVAVTATKDILNYSRDKVRAAIFSAFSRTED